MTLRIDLNTVPSSMETLAASWGQKPKRTSPQPVVQAHAQCRDCGARVGRKNKTGFCRQCCGRANWNRPGFAERQKAGIKKALQDNPQLRAAYANRARRAGEKARSDPEFAEKMRQRWIDGRYWERGNAVAPPGSEPRQRAGKAISERRLRWCPPILRDQYRNLVNNKRMKAADARRFLEEQYPAEFTRWRAIEGLK